jgi:excisionase family DNA binding protein
MLEPERYPDRLLDAEQAAEMLSVTVAAIRKWTSQRRIPAVRPGNGRAVRYRLSDMLKFLDRWTTPALRETARS